MVICGCLVPFQSLYHKSEEEISMECCYKSKSALVPSSSDAVGDPTQGILARTFISTESKC